MANEPDSPQFVNDEAYAASIKYSHVVTEQALGVDAARMLPSSCSL